ncbi:MAG: hypothetical protein J6A59_12655 [Lachnospiraceae bacterium]|nr:hypothetical protein [Lachnospiraceae bacterium]
MSNMNYEKSITKMRKKYKRKPFKEPLEHALWMKRDDKLYKLYEEYKDVYAKGEVYYAQIVMANPMMKDNTDFMDGPAVVVYSDHEWANANPEKLINIAKDVIGYKNTPDEMIPEELRATVNKFREDTDRPNFRFEYMLEGHKINVHFATMLVVRKFLPTGYLSGDIFPVLATGDMETVLTLPNIYWSKDMKKKFAENARVDVLVADEDFDEEEF